MKNIVLTLIFAILILGCKPPEVYDEDTLNKALINAEFAHESFKRSVEFTHAWLQKTDPQSGLIPSNLDAKSDLWDPANAAADNYPFMVLTAYLLDQELFKGPLLDMLHQEKKLTSRVNVLPDVYSFSKKDFEEYPLNMGHVIFGASEYIKDGLIPLNEWIGPSPWQDRMMELLDELHLYIEDFDALEQYFERASSVEEINGEMLQTLSRVFWMTGDPKYLDWALKIADNYLIDNDLSQIEYLKLRDHGCEIIGGLSELYLTLHHLDHPKKEEYQTPLYRLLDRILVYGRNADGLFYNAINLKTQKVIDDRIADTWGYTLNAYYTVWMADQKEEYLQAVKAPFKNLNQKYRSYSWEPNGRTGPLGSHDGYADAIESGINLYNREKDPDLSSWIESEIKVMFGMQQPDGIIEGWHGDGNFARTALMFGLWKTLGAHVLPWKESLKLGAISTEKGNCFVLSSSKDWQGKLIFDQMRHKSILNLPVDYPRINQFPEWFTLDPSRVYRITSSDNTINGSYSGKKLLEGIDLNLSAGAILKLMIE
jgi:hypothetical protein